MRYGLLKSGFLDEETAKDLANFDISLGSKKSFVELKNVGLNVERVSQFAQLPPGVRLETARILSLRLSFIRDGYQPNVELEFDGFEVTIHMDESEELDLAGEHRKSRSTSPNATSTPQHRKVNRRLRSPPPYDPGGRHDLDYRTHIPTTQEMAQSFLMNESPQERREMEASMAANLKYMEDSLASISSEDNDVGMGVAAGLPTLLSGVLEGVLDRARYRGRNLQIQVTASLGGDSQDESSTGIRLCIGECAGVSLLNPSLDLTDISLDLLSNDCASEDLAEPSLHVSPTISRNPTLRSDISEENNSVDIDPTTSLTSSEKSEVSSIAEQPYGPESASLPQEDQPFESESAFLSREDESSPKAPSALQSSVSTLDADRFADAADDQYHEGRESNTFDIRPGDDNISWGSRQNTSRAPAEDLWSSMLSEENVSASLMMEPERRPTSNSFASRSDSPESARAPPSEVHEGSPHQNLNSWPMLTGGHRVREINRNSGSWPQLDQDDNRPTQDLTQFISFSQSEQTVDNTANAPEWQALNDVHSSPEEESDAYQEMAESRVYSHEEAASMYMSAMTGSPSIHMPGGWTSDEHSDTSPEQNSGRDHILSVGESQASLVPPTSDEAEDPLMGNQTPKASSPILRPTSKVSHKEARQSMQRLLMIDTISLKFSRAKTDSDIESPDPAEFRGYRPDQSLRQLQPTPGAFSMYSEMSRSRHSLAASVHADNYAPSQRLSGSAFKQNVAAKLELSTSTICLQLDIARGRTLYAIVTRTQSLLASAVPGDGRDSTKVGIDTAPAPPIELIVKVDGIMVALEEQLSSPSLLTSSTLKSNRPALSLTLGGIALQSSRDTSMTIQSFRCMLGGKDLLHFRRDIENMNSSRTLTAESPVIDLKVSKNRFAANNRPIIDVFLETAHLEILIDLATIDETFNSFGGLSGMIELGGSIIADSGASSPTSSTKVPKGVRFVGDRLPDNSNPEIKFNGRINGISVALVAPSCSVVLRTTALKAVHRENGTLLSLDQIRLSGPHRQGEAAALHADLASLRLEILSSPQDKDLERLLSLLTPSSDKYDTDDDIIVDNLLRQRRKGAILKMAINDVKFRVDNWKWLPIVASLGDDLSKLSAVTKYLPEDERPGMLTLLRVKAAEAQIPVNDQFGHIRIALQDVHVAHVGLPALLALSIGGVKASQREGVEIIHALAPGAESPPTIMARILGDEEEPTLKVKLYNLCVEYSVPIVLSLMGKDQDGNSDEVINQLAQSVADLVVGEPIRTPVPRSRSDISAPPPEKKTKIDLLIHDTAIGLKPRKLPTKVFFVISDARISTIVPPGSDLAVYLELRKAELYITDAVHEDTIQEQQVAQNSSKPLPPRLTLLKQGYVEIGSIMSAVVALHVEQGDDSGVQTAVAVDAKIDLFLLETCADSTVTLFATLGDLAPPAPPSVEPKYLTQPMTIEDMMASFTGEAVQKPETTPETLFDVDDEDMAGSDLMYDIPTFDADDQELFEESEMTASLYGPVSGIFENDEFGGNDAQMEQNDNFSETVASLLDEDPFEMAEIPADLIGDAPLLRELDRQRLASENNEPTTLPDAEFDDLGFVPLGSEQQVLGQKTRFTAPHSGHRRSAKAQPDLPFRLRLRESHLIWHLYDGYDWQRTRDGIVHTVEQVEQKAEERKARRRQSHTEVEEDDSVIGDFLFNSIYIGVAAGHEAQDLRRAINRNIDEHASDTESIPVSGISRPTSYSASGQPRLHSRRRRLKLGRSKAHKIAFELSGVAADVLVFAPGSGDTVNSVNLRIKDFEIFDKVPSSTWRKFLTHMSNDPRTREMSRPMFDIEVTNVKTLESHSAAEMILHVSVLPLRLHVDQDALDFVNRFFDFKDPDLPVSDGPSEEPFIQRLEVDTVDLCLDYKPKQIDYVGLRSGRTSELKNVVTLEGSNIRLKHVIIYGLRGFDKIHPTLNDIWMEDVLRNQLPTVVAGVATVRSLVNLGTGIRDIVAIPVREYRKDGRIVRSIQKGAYQFGKTTASELARLGAKVALGTQTALTTAEQYLSTPSGTSTGRPDEGRRISGDYWQEGASDEDEPEQRAVSAYASQPLGVLAGLKTARRQLEHDLLTARDALIAVQGEIMDSAGPGGAAAAVARRAPTLLLRPVIGATRAVGTTLLGVGNQIDRSNMKKIEDVSNCEIRECKLKDPDLLCRNTNLASQHL